MFRASIRDYSDYYLGWVIQPLNWEGTRWYVYSREDSVRENKGFYITGTRTDAMVFIENKVKHS